MQDEAQYRILVVEDGLLNQHVINTILSDTYTLAKAMTAKEAFELIPQFQPHLILLDIILPDADGFDVLATLKNNEDTRNIPVIIITGLDDEANEELGFSGGAVDYIKKPFKNSIVKARVNTQIRIVRQMQTIERLGMVDALTGVPNRRAFNTLIKHEWGRSLRERTALSMMMLDIDNFKTYNDTFGHPQGDVMLQAIARTLNGALKRSTDKVFRYGGEEFAVLLPLTDLEGAVLVAERMRQGVERAEVCNICTGAVTRATVSVGVTAITPTGSDELSHFVERADNMLYLAKHDGRNRIRFG